MIDEWRPTITRVVAAILATTRIDTAYRILVGRRSLSRSFDSFALAFTSVGKRQSHKTALAHPT